MSRVLLRSRIEDLYSRVLKPDMLAICSQFAKLRSLQLSFNLHGNASLQSNSTGNNLFKAQLVKVLTVLTGQVPGEVKTDPSLTDPFIRTLSEAEKRNREQTQSTALMRSNSQGSPSSASQQTSVTSKKKSMNKGELRHLNEQQNLKRQRAEAARATEATHFKQARTGTMLVVDLNKHRAFSFLDKLSEYHLPDVVTFSIDQADEAGLINSSTPLYEMDYLTRAKLCRAHDNSLRRTAIAKRFDIWTPQYGPMRPFRAVRADENPSIAFSTYCIQLPDLLRFPDIEACFEGTNTENLMDKKSKDIGSAQSNASIITKLLESKTFLIIRATVEVVTPVPLLKDPSHVRLDNLLLMNWFLGAIFNPFLRRPVHPVGPPMNEPVDFETIPDNPELPASLAQKIKVPLRAIRRY